MNKKNVKWTSHLSHMTNKAFPLQIDLLNEAVANGNIENMYLDITVHTDMLSLG